MAAKISIALNVLLLGLGAIVAIQLSRFSTHQDTLSQRVTDLEVQNVQLAKQLSWIAENTSGKTAKSTASPSAARREMPKETRGDGGPGPGDATLDKEVLSSENVASLKADLREEVEEMVAEHQSTAREKRRAEWETRMREGMIQSLDDFADDQQLNDSVKARISELITESMTQRQNLRRELEDHNMSFYEFSQEERKMRREMEAKVSELLTDEQMEAFEESFPMGPRGGRGGRR
ncbi:MAG: hypothetical protein JXX14_02740 [Deltaproteobacteria bacterium]|nr:hypothetical protein [Deltaproteobacteria bacterium]